MSRHLHFVVLSGVLLFVLLVGLACPVAVYADDETPPPPATEEVQPPPAEEAGSETPPPIEESDQLTEVPVVQEPAATETPTEQANGILSIAEEPAAIEEVTVSEILDATPEATEVVVLNAEGSPEPLVTQEAAEIVQSGDPMWCPAGVTPQAGVGGCSDPGPGNANYDPSSLASLLAYLAANQPAQSGVIWIEANYDSSVNDPTSTSFTLDGALVFSTMGQYDLTLQGGWSGGNNTDINHNDPSVFEGASLNIQNWGGNVAINDLQIINTGGTGLTVSTTGDINLNHVSSSNNTGNGASLDNCLNAGAGCTGSGRINVGASTFGSGSTDGNGSDGLDASSGGDIVLADVTANGNGFYGAFLNNVNGNGRINIGSSVFGSGSTDGNGLNGLQASSGGGITLANVIANGNAGNGAYLDNTYSSDNINITSSTFGGFTDGNGGDGLEVYSNGEIILANVTANGNAGDGAYLDNSSGSGSIGITSSTFGVAGSGNGMLGLESYSSGNVTLLSVTAGGNGSSGASLINFFGGGDVLIRNSNFDSNVNDEGVGLEILSLGNVELDHISANNNSNGLGSRIAGLSVVVRKSSFNGNGFDGAIVYGQNVTIQCSRFWDNGGVGVDGVDVNGTFILNDANFRQNAASYTGTPIIKHGACKVIVEGKSTPLGLPLHIVPVNDGEQVGLDCNAYSGTKLILPNGDQVIFPCPIRDHGVLTSKTLGQLPAPLNLPLRFVSAMDVGVIRDGEAVSEVNAGMTIDFTIPEGQPGANLAVLRWDAQKSQWVEVSGGAQTGDGRFAAASNFTGVYVLVTK